MSEAVCWNEQFSLLIFVVLFLRWSNEDISVKSLGLKICWLHVQSSNSPFVLYGYRQQYLHWVQIEGRFVAAKLNFFDIFLSRRNDSNFWRSVSLSSIYNMWADNVWVRRNWSIKHTHKRVIATSETVLLVVRSMFFFQQIVYYLVAQPRDQSRFACEAWLVTSRDSFSGQVFMEASFSFARICACVLRCILGLELQGLEIVALGVWLRSSRGSCVSFSDEWLSRSRRTFGAFLTFCTLADLMVPRCKILTEPLFYWTTRPGPTHLWLSRQRQTSAPTFTTGLAGVLARRPACDCRQALLAR